jgi:hypothetical protein
MQIFSLLIVSFGAAFSVVWLLLYVPITSRIPFTQKYWSPRVAICRLLAPFDVATTLFLVAGAWLGLTSAAGLGVTVYNVLSGIGFSFGVVFVQKFLVPRWKKEAEAMKAGVKQ